MQKWRIKEEQARLRRRHTITPSGSDKSEVGGQAELASSSQPSPRLEISGSQEAQEDGTEQDEMDNSRNRSSRSGVDLRVGASEHELRETGAQEVIPDSICSRWCRLINGRRETETLGSRLQMVVTNLWRGLGERGIWVAQRQEQLPRYR